MLAAFSNYNGLPFPAMLNKFVDGRSVIPLVDGPLIFVNK